MDSMGAIVKRIGKFLLSTMMALAVPAAFATPLAGNADTGDVTLGGHASSLIAFSQQNPANGTTSGFSSSFALTGQDEWHFLGSTDVPDGAIFSYKVFRVDFAELMSETAGTWTITNTDREHDAFLDVVIAIHAANASTAFLFDNQSVPAGQTLSGKWAIEWLNNGGNVPAFSNVAFFDRDLALKTARNDSSDTPPGKVPEPASLALMGLGLACAVWVRRCRKAR